MPISNPEVEAGDKSDGIIGYKKRRVSLKQGSAGVFQRIRAVRCVSSLSIAKAEVILMDWESSSRHRVSKVLLEGYWKTIVSCFLRTEPLLKYQTTGLT